MGFFKSRQTGETFRTAGALGSVGLSFVLALVIGAWVGHLLDRWLHTAPTFFIVFFFVGLAAGVLNVYRTVSRAFPPSSSAPPAGAAVKPADDDEVRPEDD
jgi:ATP synthase protein I